VEFVTEFSRCASVVLRCRPFKVWWYEKRRMWCTEVSSIMLFKFMKGGLERFKELVGHCSACAASFLRGFFDSEGSVSVSGLTVSNGHLDVLVHVQYLLKRFFGIETTGPHPRGPPPGTRLTIRGRMVTVNLQSYVVRVRNMWLSKYAKSVGFSIPRKTKSLEQLNTQVRLPS
jgi:intein-encoded DNA endonuclease-like protein